MLTKNDLSQIKTVVRETIQPEIRALGAEIKTIKKSMATKVDMKALETKLIGRIDDAQMEIIATVDKHKADKDKVDSLEKRVERLEDNSGLPPYAGQ
jgi:capsule polysaccharide export protein KpsE/RkpR